MEKLLTLEVFFGPLSSLRTPLGQEVCNGTEDDDHNRPLSQIPSKEWRSLPVQCSVCASAIRGAGPGPLGGQECPWAVSFARSLSLGAASYITFGRAAVSSSSIEMRKKEVGFCGQISPGSNFLASVCKNIFPQVLRIPV